MKAWGWVVLIAGVILVNGCAAKRVMVDLDSCDSIGKFQGVTVGECDEVGIK